MQRAAAPGDCRRLCCSEAYPQGQAADQETEERRRARSQFVLKNCKPGGSHPCPAPRLISVTHHLAPQPRQLPPGFPRVWGQTFGEGRMCDQPGEGRAARTEPSSPSSPCSQALCPQPCGDLNKPRAAAPRHKTPLQLYRLKHLFSNRGGACALAAIFSKTIQDAAPDPTPAGKSSSRSGAGLTALGALAPRRWGHRAEPEQTPALPAGSARTLNAPGVHLGASTSSRQGMHT